jgi:hypothetical protein
MLEWPAYLDDAIARPPKLLSQQVLGVKAMSRIQNTPEDVVIQICQQLSVRDVLAFRQVSWTLRLGNPGRTHAPLRHANTRSRCQVSKHCGSLCVPPRSLPEGSRSQTWTESARCPHQNWRSRLARPSIETIACVPNPCAMSTHPRREWIGRGARTQPYQRFSSSPILTDTRAGVSSRFRRASGV